MIRIKTLRSFITLTIAAIATLALVCSGLFFYSKTAAVLTDNYKQLLIQQLNQINRQIYEQVSLIDSITPLFLSNTSIRDTLDPAAPQTRAPYIERKLLMERQMSYLLINNYLWNEKFINAVYIYDKDGYAYGVTPDGSQADLAEKNKEVLSSFPPDEPRLMIKTLEGDEDCLYFIRNIFSTYTGAPIATILININQHTLTRHYSSTLNQDWFVYMYNEDMSVLTKKDMRAFAQELPDITGGGDVGLLELTFSDANYFVASSKMSLANIISIVAAPKALIFEELNSTLLSYLLVLCAIVAAALMVSIFLSHAVTRPIDRMISHVKQISMGSRKKMPPLEMYSEFNEFANAFNHMLDQLDIYYRDNFEKQLLLKNAEIQALQSQMDPHFLFNVLNTIAWKAQMTDNEEIYQMVISLGELLKMNTVSKTTALIPLKDEIRYVRFYVYLQKMRFEDKITVDIQVDASLYDYRIPCFCIQPLVENAIVHGLEPKKGPGHLIINIIPTSEHMEISVIDNGIGFAEMPDVQQIRPSSTDSHTHVGLRNLDKRLELLYGESARLRISSTPNKCTTISFTVPYRSTND